MTRRASHWIAVRASPRLTRLAALFAAGALALVSLLGPAAPGVLAVDPPTMTARVLLQGHTRIGSWMAIEVHLVNSGPSISGELRLQTVNQAGTRYAIAVQLDSPSDKTWILHAQPPSAFGPQLEVVLVSGDQILVRQKVAVTVHDAGQLIVGVVAENPPKIVGSLSLPAVQNQQPAVVVPLTVADLPTRIEAWSALDRLVWQDVDASSLSTDQLTAFRGWLALGGRLVIVGGTGGIGSLGGFPDDILPYRPTSTVDVAAGSLTALLGTPPKDAADVPAMAGELVRGRALATSGDRVVAAETAYGAGSVTILGLDPTAGWVAQAAAGRSLWPALIPARADGAVAMSDDSQIVGAAGNLPSLALPPLGGLLLLLFGYIALIGPINYLVLRRIDRREWAWITMPILIVGFAVGSYAFGSALRGSSVIVNEVGIVRGAPDATEGSAQVYLGVFSPSRGTYQIAVPGGALLSAPISGDAFGGTTTALDVIQGDPSRVRNLAVGFGSLRTIRAESQATVPKVHTAFALVDGTLTGTIRNDSTVKLEKPAVVLGGNVKVLKDIAPGEEVAVSLPIVTQNQFGQSLSDRIFGQIFFGDAGATTSDNARRDQTRHIVIDQLTMSNSKFQTNTGLGAGAPVLLAWGRDAVVDVAVEGQTPNRVSNVLYYLPLTMTVHGAVDFSGDLIQSTMTASDAAFFNMDPQTMSFGQGSVTLVYRPIAFDGTLDATRLRIGLSCCPDGSIFSGLGGVDVAPIPDACLNVKAPAKPPIGCPKELPADQFDGMPEVELFDRTGRGAWHRLPHLGDGRTYDVANPARYIDPATGAVLVRLVNDRQDSINAFLSLSIQGTVK